MVRFALGVIVDKFYKVDLFFCLMIMNKIFEGVCDDEVHVAFLKFGRGEYRNKYLVEGKRQVGKWAIKAGAEYVNFLVRRCLEKVSSGDDSSKDDSSKDDSSKDDSSKDDSGEPSGESSGESSGEPSGEPSGEHSGRVAIKGIIVSTLDLKDEIGFDVVKIGNFQGIRKNVIDTEVEASEVLALMDKFPRVFFALSFKGVDFVLKIKAKAPKSGKPGGGDKSVVDFCSLKTKDKEIVDELFFGVGGFSEVKVGYSISVTDIVYPENVEELNPAEVRELAKRKGVVVREVEVDGVSRISEAGFVA